MMGTGGKTKRRRLYNCVKFRLNWNQFTTEQEAGNVVKGLSRKVIIVKSPDPKIFEQAIFIVRDDFLSAQGIGEKELLKQAQAAANGYVEGTYGWHRFPRLSPWLYASAGGALVGLCYLALRAFGAF